MKKIEIETIEKWKNRKIELVYQQIVTAALLHPKLWLAFQEYHVQKL